MLTAKSPILSPVSFSNILTLALHRDTDIQNTLQFSYFDRVAKARFCWRRLQTLLIPHSIYSRNSARNKIPSFIISLLESRFKHNSFAVLKFIVRPTTNFLCHISPKHNYYKGLRLIFYDLFWLLEPLFECKICHCNFYLPFLTYLGTRIDNNHLRAVQYLGEGPVSSEGRRESRLWSNRCRCSVWVGVWNQWHTGTVGD